ncbi:hypothetical protein L2E82_12470 [Cichorium intybus]|uniref:Uncharacterized protein n=1 Tax=Cichorium intybus TaxID=13427 RepID=A0ACB9GFM2_CICIN|nr:hypothetical protein L2E82_12470 [Cichorium intybus]
MSKFFESVGSFFSGRVQRQLPSTTVEFIGPDSEIDANDASEVAMMRRCWAMVYSYPVDVESGIVKLEEINIICRINAQHQQPVAKEEKVIPGVGYYRIGNLSKSRELLQQCLQIDQPPN